MQVFKVVIFLVLSWFTPQKQFVSIDADKISVTKNDNTLTAKLLFKIDPGLHIQDFSDTKGNVLPSEIRLIEDSSGELVSYELTKSNYEIVVLDKTEHNVLSNELEITIKIRLNNTNNGDLQGELFYQACNDRQCFFPRTLSFSVSY